MKYKSSVTILNHCKAKRKRLYFPLFSLPDNVHYFIKRSLTSWKEMNYAGAAVAKNINAAIWRWKKKWSN